MKSSVVRVPERKNPVKCQTKGQSYIYIYIEENIVGFFFGRREIFGQQSSLSWRVEQRQVGKNGEGKAVPCVLEKKRTLINKNMLINVKVSCRQSRDGEWGVDTGNRNTLYLHSNLHGFFSSAFPSFSHFPKLLWPLWYCIESAKWCCHKKLRSVWAFPRKKTNNTKKYKRENSECREIKLNVRVFGWDIFHERQLTKAKSFKVKKK